MSSVQDAMRRFGGMYGQAKRNGNVLAEVVTVTANVDIARVTVPLVGQTKQGYKAGRETREGTLSIQKIDAHWELEIYQFLSQTLVARRAARDLLAQTPIANTTESTRQFDLTIEIDDPDAWGREAWQLTGCQIWALPLGFSITDDLINREFPLTWEDETPEHAFTVTTVGSGAQTVVPYTTATPTVPPF